MRKFKKLFAGLLTLSMASSMLAAPAFAAKNVSEETSEANRALSREVAAESMVLLRNENGVLPLKEGEKIAIFGGAGGNWHKGGNGSGDVRIDQSVIFDLVEGMNEMEKAGRVDVVYTNNNEGISQADADNALNSGATTAIVVIDRNSSEGGDLSNADGNYRLNNNEKNRLNYINTAGFENIVVVLNTGRVIDTSWLTSEEQNYIDSILVAWQPGMYGGLATADVLLGDVTPSGKLTDSWAVSYEAYPSSENFFSDNYGVGVDGEGFNGNFWYTNYTEDIYMGYRYFETFAPEDVIYEFGYGLSYTTFELSGSSVTNDGKNITVSVDVKNTGNAAGKEVVQVYFSAPQGLLGKPAKELAGFAKTDLLEPGETETVEISFPIADMSSYDDTGKTGNKSAYVLEAGTYNIFVGTSIRKVTEAGSYTVSALTVTEQLTEQVESLQLEQRMVNNNGEIGFEDLTTYRDLTDASDRFVELNAGSATRIEAEDSPFHQRYARTEHSGNTAGLRVNGENEDGTNIQYTWVDFYVYAAEAGNYDLRLGYGLNNVSCNVKVEVNGTEDADQISLSGTGGKWAISEFGPMTIGLEKGNNIVRVKLMTNGGIDGAFDYVTFTPAGTEYATPETQYTPAADPAENKGITFLDVYNGNATVEELVDQMTYAELADLLSGNRANDDDMDAQGTVGKIAQYQIPSVHVSDGPAGVDHISNGGQTAWPIGTAVASTWNPDLIEEMGYAFGTECSEVDVDVILTPGINLHRNPLCGRNFEYMSEDPLVSGKMSAALVRGLQDGGVSACLKHFAANEREKSRYYTETRASERALRELYLKSFEIAVKESDPDYVMTTYNRVNGYYTSENKELVTTVLRDEWGFSGAVFTDWWNGGNQALEVMAGNDLKMQNADTNEVEMGLATGRIPREDALACAERIVNNILNSNAPARMLDQLEEQMRPLEIEADGANAFSAADFNASSDAVQTENNGTSIGYFDNGAWVDFYLNVEAEGDYALNMNVASTGDGSIIQIYIDGELVHTFTNNTGSAGWTDWKAIEPITLHLPEGQHTMRLVSPAGSINVQNMSLPPVFDYTLGDVDADGDVDATDIVKTKLLILANDWGIQQLTAGDLNGNGKLDVVDIVKIQLLILESAPAEGDAPIVEG